MGISSEINWKTTKSGVAQPQAEIGLGSSAKYVIVISETKIKVEVKLLFN